MSDNGASATAGNDAGGTAAGGVALDSSLGRIVVATTVAGSAVAMLTATVVNVALPAIADDMGASSAQQQWVVNSYLLTIASLILIGGSLGDRYGRVRIYRVGVAWFAVASLLCAVAPTVELLIVARLLQGIGGALLTPGSLAIIEATLRPDDRGRGVGQWSGLGGIAAAIGPLVGGLLIDLSWRWVFLINLPMAVAVLVLSVRLPESFDRSSTGTRLDVPGSLCTVGLLGGASYALIEGPAGGFSAIDLAAVAVAVVSLVGLATVERRTEHPMVPFDLFGNRTFAVANVITVLVYGGMGVVFFLLSIQLQVTAGFSPLAAGATFLPVTLLMLALSSHAGDLASRIGPRWPLTIGPLLIAAGMLLYIRIDEGSSYVVDVLPGVIVFGLGLSASVAPVTATALGSVPEARSGAASGANNAISRSGQLLAVAAVPPLVGLTGDALNDPAQLEPGFTAAMVAGASLVALGAVAAAILLRPAPAPRARGVFHRACPVDGAHPHTVTEAVHPAGR